jgi:excisionase family DNA binding protein
MNTTTAKFERDGFPTAVLDAREAAAYLAVAESTIRRMVRRGELPHVRMGEVGVRFPLVDLDAWLAARTSREWTPAKGRGPAVGCLRKDALSQAKK